MSKPFSMRMFKVNDDLTIVCHAESTRSGFRHLAWISRGGWINSVEKPAKVTYLNRTWEAFEFETVLHVLADNKKNNLTDAERTAIRNLTWRD